MNKHDALNDMVRRMLLREGYTVSKVAKGWQANGLLPRHKFHNIFRSEDDAWKACREDYYWRKEHPTEN